MCVFNESIMSAFDIYNWMRRTRQIMFYIYINVIFIMQCIVIGRALQF